MATSNEPWCSAAVAAATVVATVTSTPSISMRPVTSLRTREVVLDEEQPHR